MMPIRRVQLEDIPRDQAYRITAGKPWYRVFVRNRQGGLVVDYRRNDPVRSWALFGWMRNYPRAKD